LNRKLPAIASSVSIIDDDGVPELKDEPMPIPHYYWERLQDVDSFLNGGTAHFKLGRGGIDGWRDVRCYGVMFLKAQIESQFPGPDHRELSEEPPEPQGPPDTRPRVSDPDLAKWAALYVAYSPDEDTLDKCWASAKGMFQGKSVARDRAVKYLARFLVWRPQIMDVPVPLRAKLIINDNEN
jgi:hypothetical protein